MGFQSINGKFVSDDGWSIDFEGAETCVYEDENGRQLAFEFHQHDNPYQWVFSPFELKWEAPHQKIPLTKSEYEKVQERLAKAFAAMNKFQPLRIEGYEER